MGLMRLEPSKFNPAVVREEYGVERGGEGTDMARTRSAGSRLFMLAMSMNAREHTLKSVSRKTLVDRCQAL